MKYIVHIGYAKAASSWLQRAIFSGADSRIMPLDQSVIVDGACKSGGEIFYDQIPPVADRKKNALKHPHQLSAFGLFDSSQARYTVDARTNQNAVWTCLSNEVWTGHPYSGGVHGPIYLKRIKATLPEAKILIVVRNPISAIISTYADYMVRARGLCTFLEFLNPDRSNQVPRFLINYYKYINLIKEYDNAFGQENVLVVPFELIKKSEKNFAFLLYQSLELSMPIDIPKNEKVNVQDYRKLVIYEKCPLINIFGRKAHGNGRGALEWEKFHWLVSQLHRLVPDAVLKSHSSFLEGILLDYYGDYLVQSNKSLEVRMNINLRDLGYLT